MLIIQKTVAEAGGTLWCSWLARRPVALLATSYVAPNGQPRTLFEKKRNPFFPQNLSWEHPYCLAKEVHLTMKMSNAGEQNDGECGWHFRGVVCIPFAGVLWITKLSRLKTVLSVRLSFKGAKARGNRRHLKSFKCLLQLFTETLSLLKGNCLSIG